MDRLEVKVVVLGDSGVGKSCIVLRYVTNSFKPNGETTLGAAFLTKSIQYEDKTIKFNLWDTAGQEKYHALAPMYYRDADAAILVYDTTNYNSYQVLQKWVNEIQQKGPDQIIICIVGNKNDLNTENQVDSNEAKKFADNIGAIFQLTSAKDNTGIDDVFRGISEELINLKLDNQSQSDRRQTTFNSRLSSKFIKKQNKSCC